jgi:hypothetical protein
MFVSVDLATQKAMYTFRLVCILAISHVKLNEIGWDESSKFAMIRGSDPACTGCMIIPCASNRNHEKLVNKHYFTYATRVGSYYVIPLIPTCCPEFCRFFEPTTIQFGQELNEIWTEYTF